MKRSLLVLLLTLLLAWVGGRAFGANDFSTDAHCLAVYQLENGALTVDSKGTNTLAAGAFGSPAADTVDYQEALASAEFASASMHYLKCADASLTAGFPGKNGLTTYDFSVTFWVKFADIGTGGGLVRKGSYTSANGWMVYRTVGDKISLFVYITGVDTCSFNLNTSVAASKWYHVGVTFQAQDGGNESARIRVYDLAAGDYLAADATSDRVAVGGPPGCTEELRLGNGQGGFGYLNGNLDEVVIFDDVLTTDEIDAIRGGTYGGNDWWWRRRN